MNKILLDNRIKFPKNAIVTAGLPNGNKELHIGHISTFIWADTISRFLKDAVGKENVLFISSTDCYGSMVVEKFRAWQNDGFSGRIEDVINKYHNLNKKTLEAYNIGCDFFGANCFEPMKSIHEEVSKEVFLRLLENKSMEKYSNLMFYDEKLNMFLNGRQVSGKCPIDGCKSEDAYADECALGHQYAPAELLEPISRLSFTKPILKENYNYYFNLQNYSEFLTEFVNGLETRNDIRPAMVKEMKEFLKRPIIFIHENSKEKIKIIKDALPKHKEEIKNNNLVLEFNNIKDREKAVEILKVYNIRFRTSKALVPFRITGNSNWGVPVPEFNEEKNDFTFYVWPESLWAPISSTKTYLKENNIEKNWKEFWCNEESSIYQVIGEDNIYFYTLCEPAIFKSLNWGLNMPTVISNKHTLIGGLKAATSGIKKAPTAFELLSKYTVDQLKMYFLGQSVAINSVEFKSKAFYPELFENEEDPLLREGNILTNIFNRIVRSVFYTISKYFENAVPFGFVSKEVYNESIETILTFEKNMMNFDLHKNVILLDVYFRNANKNWAKEMTNACKENNINVIKKLVIDTLFVIKTGIMMLHSITPNGSELVAEKLNLNKEIFNWKNIFEPIYTFINNKEFRIDKLEPKFDFFKKHSSQFEDK